VSVPNQKIIRIEKDKYQSRFLQIGDEQWKKAFQTMKPTVFGMYLYLASNKDGYLLELSAAAVEREIGIKKTAYHTALKDLEEKGYLKKEQGNTYAFSPSPKFASANSASANSASANLEVRICELPTPRMRTSYSANANLEVRGRDIEIDKIDKIDKIDITDIEKEKLEGLFGKDGALLKGEGWIDTYIPNFYGLAREKQIEMLSATPIFGLTIPQAEYVVDKILN
jgi:hypothetical protein